MYEEPDESRQEHVSDPKQRAREKTDEFRIHAEVCAVFEGPRKFDARVLFDLKDEAARDLQQRIARLEKSKAPESPILPPGSMADAAALLNLAAGGMSTNDYHIRRRPGELMIGRWLEGEQVESFYERIQAHFDVALDEYREEERQTHGWKQDRDTLAYLAALDDTKLRLSDRYLRNEIRKHNLFVLSTLTADEMDILHLCDYVMGVPAPDIVSAAFAPGEEPTERERAWFFKLFSLRGIVDGAERMLFFTFMQKAEDTFDTES